jgi:hypothetical protein
MNCLLIPGGFAKHQYEMTKAVIETLSHSVDDFAVINIYKSEKLKSLCKEIGCICISFGLDISKPDLKFNYCMKKFEDFLLKNNVSSIFIFRQPITKAYKKGNVKFVNKGIEKMQNNKDASSVGNKPFNATDKMFKQICLIMASCNICKNIIQLIIDPQESMIDEWYDFGNDKKLFKKYILNHNELSYAPFYELSLLTKISFVNNKKYDMVSFYTVLSSDRKRYVNFEKEIQDDKILLNAKSSNTAMQQSEYYNLLSQSKYTLIIKPYDNTTFSPIRMFEALSRGCIPLIENEVCLNDLLCTFPDLYDVIKKWNLEVELNSEAIKQKMKQLDNKRGYILFDFLNSESVKKITNKKKVKKYYRRLLDV